MLTRWSRTLIKLQSPSKRVSIERFNVYKKTRDKSPVEVSTREGLVDARREMAENGLEGWKKEEEEVKKKESEVEA